MKLITSTLAAAGILLSASAFASSPTFLGVQAYLQDEGSAATFLDGAENGYYPNTPESRVDYFFADQGQIDTDFGIWEAIENSRGLRVLASRTTLESGVPAIIKYRHLSNTWRVDFGNEGKYAIAADGDLEKLASIFRGLPLHVPAGLAEWVEDAGIFYPDGSVLFEELKEQLNITD